MDGESGSAARQECAEREREAGLTWALRIAAVALLILAAAAFRHWDLYHIDPGHPRYVQTRDWAGGPDILQLTAFVWLAAVAVICLLVSLRDK